MGNKLKRSFIYLFLAWNLILAITAYAQINSPHILPDQFFFVKTIRIEGNALLPDRKLDGRQTSRLGNQSQQEITSHELLMHLL